MKPGWASHIEPQRGTRLGTFIIQHPSLGNRVVNTAKDYLHTAFLGAKKPTCAENAQVAICCLWQKGHQPVSESMAAFQ